MKVWWFIGFPHTWLVGWLQTCTIPCYSCVTSQYDYVQETHTCMHGRQIVCSQSTACVLLTSVSLLLPNRLQFVSRQLVAAWVAVVQDYTVLSTHGPLVQAAYTPRLFPAPSLSIIAKLLPNLHSCWPAALTALAATLPQAEGICTPLCCACSVLVKLVHLNLRLSVDSPCSFAHLAKACLDCCTRHQAQCFCCDTTWHSMGEHSIAQHSTA